VIPLRDSIRPRSFPWMTWLIILANVAVFIIELGLTPRGLNRFFLEYGLVPAAVDLRAAGTWSPLLTSMFVHGGWLHILSNMWALYIFGDNVEDRLGPLRYLVFYLLAGIVAGLLSVWITPASAVPMVGASGAIAGVLGGYLLLYPRGRVLTLVPIFLLPWLIEIPSIVYLGFWFVSQFWSGLASLGGGGMLGDVAWWAHVGGFAAGLLMVLILRPRLPRLPRNDLPVEVVFHPPDDLR
jgi:membrane associated rhomboid family serine protease